MRPTPLLAAFLAPTALAAGTAHVTNHCPFPVYLYSVPAAPQTEHPLPPGADYVEPMHKGTDGTGGIALKVYRAPGALWGRSAALNFGYTLDKARVW
jgi:hypothetical protein